MVTDTEKVSQSGVINIGLSDHMLVFCTRKVAKPKFDNHLYHSGKINSRVQYREDFVQTLGQLDWSDVMSSISSSKAWSY